MLHITFRNLDSSASVRALADELLARIRKNHGETSRCHLVLEDQAGSHNHHAERFAAHLELSIPRNDMRFQSQSAHQDAATAIREVFDKIDRQLTRREDRLSDTQSGRARG